MPKVNLGRVGFVLQGNHSTTKTYKRLDCVMYNNATYAAIEDVPTGTAITNTQYWQLLIDANGILQDIDAFKDHLIMVQDTEPTEADNRLWIKSTQGDEVQIPTWAEHEALAGEVDKKTIKHLLTYDGTNIKEDSTVLTYAAIHAMLMDKPDFVVLVYNERAYHPTRVSNDQIVFIASFVSNGYPTMDRISISNKDVVTVTTGTAEMKVNKVSSVNDANKADADKYPSVKAVVDYVQPTIDETTKIKSDLAAQRAEIGTPYTVEWVDGYRIKTPFNIGDTVDPTPVISSPFRYALVECEQGDLVKIIGEIHGGYNYRPYVFVDENYNIVGVGKDTSYAYSDCVVVAPQNSAYAIFNDEYKTAKITIGISNIEKLQKGKLSSIIEGKKIVCMGDSLFGRFDGDDAIHNIIADKSGATVYNCAFGGTHAATPVSDASIDWFDFTRLVDAKLSGDYSKQDASLPANPSTTMAHYAPHLELFKSIDFSQIDYLTISYGTNDWYSVYPIYEGDKYGPRFSIVGALQYGIEALLNAYPSLVIVLCTPMYRCEMSNGAFVSEWIHMPRPDKFGANRTLIEISEAISKLAKDMLLPCCEFHKQLGVNQYTAVNYFSGNDGTHPNENGRKRMAQKLLGVLLDS